MTPVQKSSFHVKDTHGTFYNEKKCKDKDLIWHMVGEMVKKNRIWQGCLFRVITPAHSTF